MLIQEYKLDGSTKQYQAIDDAIGVPVVEGRRMEVLTLRRRERDSRCDDPVRGGTVHEIMDIVQVIFV